MDNSVYRHLLSKLKKSENLPHHNFAGHNLLSIENLLEVSENLNVEQSEHSARFLSTFPCYHPFPYAVHKNFPLFCGSGHTDDANQLVKEKLKWQKQLKNLKLNNINKVVHQIKALKQNRVVRVSESVRKCINHFHNDPEPKFYGNYNWLYTGGTVDYVEEHDGLTLVTADFFEDKPGFNTLKLNESSDKVEYRTSATLKSYSPVLQVNGKSNGSNFLVCVRQKDHVNLFSIREAGRLSHPSKVWRKKVLPPKLIVCAELKPGCEEVLLSDSTHDVHVFHIERKTKLYGCAGRKIFSDVLRDPWSQVAFGELGLYVAFRDCFVALDPRVCCLEEVLRYTPSPVVNSCEDICGFVQSASDSNFLYLAMTHSVLQVDLRNGGAVQKWTHLMKKPPQFLRSAKDGQGGELLVLQSQEVDETVGIVNGCREDEGKVSFMSESLPCLLRSVKESLREARFEGVCLSPFVAERMSFAVTGMQCLKNSAGDMSIFTKNSAGDVFLSKVRAKGGASSEEEGGEEVVEAMKTYEACVEGCCVGESLGGQLEPMDLSHVVRDLKESEARVERRRKGEFCWKHYEMYAPENLEFCRDLLAQRILSVWGFEEEDAAASEPDVSVNDKVEEWMSRN